MSNDELTDRQLQLLASARTHDDPVVVEATEAKQVDQAKELLSAADGVADPAVVESADADRLDEATDLLDAAEGIDDPTVVSETDHEALQDDVDAVQDILGGVLVDQRGLRDQTVEAMGLQAMVSEFRDDEGDIDLAALSQHPETGGTDTSGSDGGSDGSAGGSTGDGLDLDSLSVEERNEAKDKLRRAEIMENRTPNHAEALREEAASIVGVDADEAGDLDREVL